MNSFNPLEEVSKNLKKLKTHYNNNDYIIRLKKTVLFSDKKIIMLKKSIIKMIVLEIQI